MSISAVSISYSASRRAVQELLSIPRTSDTDGAICGLALKILHDHPFAQTKDTINLKFKHNATTIDVLFSKEGELLHFTDGKIDRTVVKQEFVTGMGIAISVIAARTMLSFLPFLAMEGGLALLTNRSFNWVNVLGFGLISALPKTIASCSQFKNFSLNDCGFHEKTYHFEESARKKLK